MRVKIAIIGAGAIGGYVGAKLALAGEDVTFIVRGANLEVIRKKGMKLIMHDGVSSMKAACRASRCGNHPSSAPIRPIIGNRYCSSTLSQTINKITYMQI